MSRTFIERVTFWTNTEANVIQVAVAYLDPFTWEPLAEVTLPVGPFDVPEHVELTASEECRAMVNKQIPGQQEIPLP